jgi:5-methylcytosine-specific restriction protein A
MFNRQSKPRTLADKQESNGRTLGLNTAAWAKLRRYVLAGEPCCRHCTAEGLTVPATEVDHADNNPSNNALENLQPLCKPHHLRKTQRDMRHDVAERTSFDTSGLPTNPRHPWNKSAYALLTPRRDEKSPERQTPSTA